MDGLLWCRSLEAADERGEERLSERGKWGMGNSHCLTTSPEGDEQRDGEEKARRQTDRRREGQQSRGLLQNTSFFLSGEED